LARLRGDVASVVVMTHPADPVMDTAG